MWHKLFGIGKLDRGRFTDLVARLGVELGRFDKPEVDRDAMRITSRGDVLFLANLHAQFLAIPRRHRLAYVRDVVLAPDPVVPATWTDAKPLLRSVVRDAAHLTITQLQAQVSLAGPPMVVAHRQIAPGLYETAAIDSPTRILSVTEAQLATWGVSLDELLDAARANLRERSQDPFIEVASGLWAAPWQDSYDAARVALPEVLQRVCTDPLVAAPTRDVLLVADPRIPSAFESLVNVIEKTSPGARYAITRQIYQLDHKTLRRYDPPPVAARARYELLLAEELVASYQEEAELRAQAGDDAFWATVIATKSPDGEIETRVAWTEGVVEGYLPPVHTICFVVPAEPTPRIWSVPWRVVEAEPGMLTPTDAPLPRWKIGPFPSTTWLASNGQQIA